jgi:hypothetical protein
VRTDEDGTHWTVNLGPGRLVRLVRRRPGAFKPGHQARHTDVQPLQAARAGRQLAEATGERPGGVVSSGVRGGDAPVAKIEGVAEIVWVLYLCLIYANVVKKINLSFT